MSDDLGAFSTDQLLAEIVRRRNAEEGAEAVVQWCEDCDHFKFSASDTDIANNCQKGHAMKFRVPEDWPDDDYGFFRRVCADRAARPAAPPPPARTRPRLAPR